MFPFLLDTNVLSFAFGMCAGSLLTAILLFSAVYIDYRRNKRE